MSLTALENIDVIHPIKLTIKYEKLPLVCLTFILGKVNGRTSTAYITIF
jgi:hypothetical protein